MAAEQEPRAIKSGTQVTLDDGRVAVVLGFVANDRVRVVIRSTLKREDVAYQDLALVPRDAYLDCSPAEMKRRTFAQTEHSMAEAWRATGRDYPGRAALHPNDPWGEAAGSADTMNPWWVTLAPLIAIECAISAVTPWDVSLESDLHGTWFLYVFDADGNEVIPDAEYAENTPAAEVIASALKALNAAR